MLLRVRRCLWTFQIIASLTRERTADREDEYGTSLERRRKKTTAWRSADLVFALGAPRCRCSVFTKLQMKMVTLWETKTRRAGGYVNIGVRFFQARTEGERHHCHETIMRYVQNARRLLTSRHKKRIRSWSRWDSTRFLLMCWRIGLSISLQCVQTRV